MVHALLVESVAALEDPTFLPVLVVTQTHQASLYAIFQDLALLAEF
jgi:hypothetical protein